MATSKSDKYRSFPNCKGMIHLLCLAGEKIYSHTLPPSPPTDQPSTPSYPASHLHDKQVPAVNPHLAFETSTANKNQFLTKASRTKYLSSLFFPLCFPAFSSVCPWAFFSFSGLHMLCVKPTGWTRKLKRWRTRIPDTTVHERGGQGCSKSCRFKRATGRGCGDSSLAHLPTGLLCF